jgi:hypothetical protein
MVDPVEALVDVAAVDLDQLETAVQLLTLLLEGRDETFLVFR